MATKYEEAKNRTCVPAWKGLKYIPPTARHWNSALITDEEAQTLLKNGFLKVTDFQVLPTKQEEEKEPVKSEKKFTKPEMNCIVEFKELMKAGKTEKEILFKYKDVKKIGTKKCTRELLKTLIKEAGNEAA